MTVDLFPLVLANVVDIQKEHILLQLNTQVIRCELVCKTLYAAAYTLYICISDKTNMPCLKCPVEYWFHQILEGDRKIYYAL